MKYFLTIFLLLIKIGVLIAQNPVDPLYYHQYGKSKLSTPNALVEDIEIRRVTTVKDNAVRLAYNKAIDKFYYLTTNGQLFQINFNSGIHYLKAQTEDHGINETLGLAISSSGVFYVSGTNKNSENLTNVGRVSRGVLTDDKILWETLIETEEYPLSNTAFDHSFNGIVLSPSEKTLFINSGSRTDHGEVHSVNGRYPDSREVPLTAKLLQVPADTNNLYLPNNYDSLKFYGYIYAEGLRNTFDLAFDSKGNLFGTENSGDRDDSEELNIIVKGGHYGFPWLMGGNLTPMQFDGYNVENDLFVNTNSLAYRNGYFYNDPNFPLKPDSITFIEGLKNIGPDADRKRGEDGQVYDVSESNLEIRTFTSHRSPLGLVFDTMKTMGGDYNGDGFLLGWTGSNDSNLLQRMGDEGDDMFHLKLIDSGDGYSVSVNRIVSGFLNPIDAEIVDNKIYVLEFKSSWINSGLTTSIYEITFPSILNQANQKFSSKVKFVLYQNYPNPFNASTQIRFELEEATKVRLEVFNSIGQKILELVNGRKSAGYHTATFDASGLSSGVYLYKLTTPSFTQTKKMLLIK